MTTLGSATYSEASGRDAFKSVPYSHLSIEVGHFYMDDLRLGEDRIRAHFERVGPWIAAARATVRLKPKASPRISTCFLVDDYFRNDTNPKEVLETITRIGEEFGISIDYVAREAACHEADGVPLAELTAARLLPEPSLGTNGTRPSAQESGWLSNGERTAATETDEAMRAKPSAPPQEFGSRNHSIVLDAELWRDDVQRSGHEDIPVRLWSCPFLASVWHLLRLGMLRNYGEAVAVPRRQLVHEDDSWDDLPPVLQLNPDAAPFCAYRAVSILPQYYLPIENAVRLILDRVSLDPPVVEQVLARAAHESVAVPPRTTNRLSFVFVEDVQEKP